MREIFSEGDGETLKVDYRGTPTPLLKLGLATTLLTIITLGVYRFWARTRMRRYFWSAIAPGGDALEYTGTGLEKFLGFLIAVAFLAVYLGLVQLGLFFANLSMINAHSPALQIAGQYITILAVLPLIFYAQYRGRRYILSRTRWRGLRFGVDKAAFGYVWRGMVYTFMSLISLGLLLPLQMFQLEKYKVDRTWYGTARFEQAGNWYNLYPAAKHVIVGVLLIALPGVILGFSHGTVRWPVAVMFLGAIWLPIGLVYFAVHSFRILTQYKVLDDTVRFTSLPRTGRVIGIYLLGSLGTAVIASVIASMILAVFAAIAASFSSVALPDLATMQPDELASNGPLILLIAAGVGLFYLFTIVLFSALSMVLIRQPLLEHYAKETTILHAEMLDRIKQREGDEMVEAEGFADALDVGAAI